MKKHLLSALLAMCLVTTAFAQQGKVYETRTVKSKILGMERSYSIYLPAGYDEGDGSYPVLYLLHGLGDNHTGWVQFGQVQYIADKAIAEGKSAPMIIQSDLSKVSEEKKAEVLGQMDIQTILEKSPKEKLDRIKWIRWYISCGDDDFLSVTNCLLHNTLLQHQVGHEFRMKDGSHSWTYWRMELPEVMRFVSRIFTQY